MDTAGVATLSFFAGLHAPTASNSAAQKTRVADLPNLISIPSIDEAGGPFEGRPRRQSSNFEVPFWWPSVGRRRQRLQLLQPLHGLHRLNRVVVDARRIEAAALLERKLRQCAEKRFQFFLHRHEQ